MESLGRAVVDRVARPTQSATRRRVKFPFFYLETMSNYSYIFTEQSLVTKTGMESGNSVTLDYPPWSI
jgi:hypothetical protein